MHRYSFQQTNAAWRLSTIISFFFKLCSKLGLGIPFVTEEALRQLHLPNPYSSVGWRLGGSLLQPKPKPNTAHHRSETTATNWSQGYPVLPHNNAQTTPCYFSLEHPGWEILVEQLEFLHSSSPTTPHMVCSDTSGAHRAWTELYFPMWDPPPSSAGCIQQSTTSEHWFKHACGPLRSQMPFERNAKQYQPSPTLIVQFTVLQGVPSSHLWPSPMPDPRAVPDQQMLPHGSRWRHGTGGQAGRDRESRQREGFARIYKACCRVAL